MNSSASGIINISYALVAIIFIHLSTPAAVEGADCSKSLKNATMGRDAYSAKGVFGERLLSSSQIAIINEHPIANLRCKRGSVVKLVPRRSSARAHVFGGEDKQVLFLEAVLSRVCPNSVFVGGEKKERPDGSSDLFFRVEDTAESNSISNIPSQFYLEMYDIKAANGNYGEQVPRTLSLPHKEFVHLYIRDPFMARENFDKSLNPNLKLVFEKMMNLGERVFVLSSRQLREFEQALALLKQEAGGAVRLFDHIVPLSELRKGPRALSGKVLILNDMMGVMTEVHQEAKAVYVQGPINFFEALYTATPTIVMDSHLTRDGYRDSAMEKMLGVAESFPRFRELHRLEDLSFQFADSSRNVSPDFDSYEAFRDFLDVLYRKLQKQLAAGNV